MVKRGKEVDVEYSRNFIIERINKFLGYEFVNKIKLSNFKDKKKWKKSLYLQLYFYLTSPF